jgi:hypothetical protein
MRMDFEEEDEPKDEYVYDEPDHVRFVEDMTAAGLRTRHYRGRWYWEGPAVVVEDLQDALGATKVRCQWDNLARDWIVYPKAYGTARRIGDEDESEEPT